MIIKIVLTGFGCFSNVTLNPTQQIIEILQKENWRPTTTITADKSIVELTTEIIEVSTTAASEFLDKIAINFTNQINRNSTTDDDILIYMIHLGVDSNATSFKLENMCYNNMTFRVPDQRGFQPSGIPIDTTEAFDGACATALPLMEVNATLIDEGYPVVVSSDPGRYLCNYIYFKSLQYTSGLNHTQQQQQQQGRSLDLLETPRRRQHHSLFIHVPPLTVVPLEQQCSFIKNAVERIVNCVL